MKIKAVTLANFRSFDNQTVRFGAYTCIVGPNGAGKSAILAALNVFFQESENSSTDVSRLIDQDFFRRNIARPVQITVTFEDLSAEARSALGAYVRNGELVVTAEARFDPEKAVATVRHFGSRLGFESFRYFFEQEKAGAKATELDPIYAGLKRDYPDLPAARSKADKLEALRTYEAQFPDDCVLIPSEDDFYGINSTGKLRPFVQWVYVPAVKDAGEEGSEGRNTMLGRLVARAVRARTTFSSDLEQLRIRALADYQTLLDANREHLRELSAALRSRLADWAHTGVALEMEWSSDPTKAVQLASPIAELTTGEAGFVGKLERMGHGLQRSYLLALLQELANADAEGAPTLILGCEEPELYQHPPQARHLATVLERLAERNNQVILTTHSPFFVSGDGFEATRVVNLADPLVGSSVRAIEYQELSDRIRRASGNPQGGPHRGMIAKIHQAVQPRMAEIFFARVPILVEGLEDVAYLTAQFHALGKWSEFHRLGCHIIQADKKSQLLLPIAIAQEFRLPVFTMFDADGDVTKPEWRRRHEQDNTALFTILDMQGGPFPSTDLFSPQAVIWSTSLSDVVRTELSAVYQTVTDEARTAYDHEGGLEKHELFIADWVTRAALGGHLSQSLTRVCESILAFASQRAGG